MSERAILIAAAVVGWAWTAMVVYLIVAEVWS